MSATTKVTRLDAPASSGPPAAVTQDPHARMNDPLTGLLRLIAGGDERAFARLYEQTAAKLFALILAIIRRRDLAEEILQESFVRVWKSAYRFDPAKGSAMAWLVTIARNRTLTALERTPRDQAGPEAADWEMIADGAPDPLEQALISSEARALSRCLQELEQDQRRSIVLAYYKGLTHVELAGRLDKPLGTVKSWVRRGLLQLRGCLENDPQ